MPRHDAFGNDLTPSTGSGGLPGMPESDGPPSRRPRTPTPRSPSRPPRPRATPQGLIVGLAVAAMVGLFGLGLLSSPDEKAQPGSVASPGLTPPTPTDSPDTLFTLDVLSDRLTALADAGFVDVGFALLRPGVMTITTRDEEGRTSLVEVRPTGEPSRISAVRPTSLQSFAPLSDIDPTVPEKLVKRVLDDGRTVQDIDALAVSVDEKGIEWQTQMRDDSVYFADADGRVTSTLP